MTFTILTLFPDFFASPLQSSILKRATEQAGVTFEVVDIRDYTTDKHRTTDDRPFGGGPGMVLKVEPIDRALAALPEKNHIILTSAKGPLFTQEVAKRLAKLDHITIICGHYEGVDERVAEHFVDEELRIGDYVLTGGEPAALVMVDAVTRLLPDVLGNEDSTVAESHAEPGLLGYPQYTRPEIYKDWPVPKVLLSGDHRAITDWRKGQSKMEQRRDESS